MSLKLEPRLAGGPLEGIDRIMGLIFGRRNKPIQGDRLETVIGASTRFTGDLSVDGGVRIDGQFEGSLEAGGNVVIGEQGRVVADISARHITVGGAVKGNVRATGRLEILKTGHVFGDIHASQVLIDDGGVFQGMGLLGAKDLPALAAPAHDALHPLRDVDPAEVAALEAGEGEGIGEGAAVEAESIVDPELEAGLGPEAAAPAGTAPAEAAPARPAATKTEAKAKTETKAKATSEIIPPQKKPARASKRVRGSSSSDDPAVGGQAADPRARPKGLSGIAARARAARRPGGLGRGLDLNPLDGDLEIEPIIPDLGQAEAGPAAKPGSGSKDAQAQAAKRVDRGGSGSDKGDKGGAHGGSGSENGAGAATKNGKASEIGDEDAAPSSKDGATNGNGRASSQPSGAKAQGGKSAKIDKSQSQGQGQNRRQGQSRSRNRNQNRNRNRN